jgi:hypothetical protein
MLVPSHDDDRTIGVWRVWPNPAAQPPRHKAFRMGPPESGGVDCTLSPGRFCFGSGDDRVGGPQTRRRDMD